MSFSKYNVNALTDPLSALPSPIIRRPRQNSVFVGSPGALAALTMGAPPPRRVKSAVDIQHLLIASDRISPTGNRKGSIVPIFPSRDRRPSLITIERPAASRHRRPSIAIERPFCPPSHRPRRSSCFVTSPGPPAQHTLRARASS
nr:unnamed protein product [Callosobruchus chinensis]